MKIRFEQDSQSFRTINHGDRLSVHAYGDEELTGTLAVIFTGHDITLTVGDGSHNPISSYTISYEDLMRSLTRGEAIQLLGRTSPRMSKPDTPRTPKLGLQPFYAVLDCNVEALGYHGSEDDAEEGCKIPNRAAVMDQASLLILIRSGIEALAVTPTVAVAAKPVLPDPDEYTIRCTIPRNGLDQQAIVSAIQYLYDVMGVAGNFTTDMDESMVHISFQRSVSTDEGYIGQMVANYQYTQNHGAIAQLRSEFKGAREMQPHPAYYEEVERALLEQLSEPHRCDVRWPA